MQASLQCSMFWHSLRISSYWKSTERTTVLTKVQSLRARQDQVLTAKKVLILQQKAKPVKFDQSGLCCAGWIRLLVYCSITRCLEMSAMNSYSMVLFLYSVVTWVYWAILSPSPCSILLSCPSLFVLTQEVADSSLMYEINLWLKYGAECSSRVLRWHLFCMHWRLDWATNVATHVFGCGLSESHAPHLDRSSKNLVDVARALFRQHTSLPLVRLIKVSEQGQYISNALLGLFRSTSQIRTLCLRLSIVKAIAMQLVRIKILRCMNYMNPSTVQSMTAWASAIHS